LSAHLYNGGGERLMRALREERPNLFCMGEPDLLDFVQGWIKLVSHDDRIYGSKESLH
jgi:hypothetical protein